MPAATLGFVTRRPVEVGPRTFEQDVDTWYFNTGLEGTFGSESRFHWDLNLVTSENNASQTFENGYNIGKIKIALGDPAVCAANPGCVPLDLFGGQGRPMTADMINYIRTTQIDSSKQTLQLISANLTGDMFHIGDRTAGFAVGAEHREYKGEFAPDPLRRTGESQDSFASPVSEDYDVSELYGEVSLPLLESLDVSAAVRWSDYSTFGAETTGKVGLRWQPIEALAFRGTYSKGFRAPNLGELFGLTQFAATLTDPCGPTGTVVVNDADGINTTPLETACRAQGVQSGFEQANTQITTFTGGNPDLDPEKSDSYTVGIVHDATWAESFSQRLTFELTYFSHDIESGIQARDLAALLDACLAAGGTDPTLCSPFTRAPSGNLNPPQNFLDNLGSIKTDGFDFKVDWRGSEQSWGTLTFGLQSTFVTDYTATDTDGIVSQRAEGIEVSDSAIPEMQINCADRLGEGCLGSELRYALHRFGGRVLRQCADPGCPGMRRNAARDFPYARLGDVQRRDGRLEPGLRRGELQDGARDQQHLRRGSADLLQLLAQRLRRGHVRPARYLLGGDGQVRVLTREVEGGLETGTAGSAESGASLL